MENKELSPEQGIELIKKMIESTRTRYEKNGGSFFLIWGYVSLFVGVIYIVGRQWTDAPEWGLVWWAVPAIGWPIMWAKGCLRTPEVTTYIDRVTQTAWVVVGAFTVGFPLVSLLSGYLVEVILPIEAMLLCIGMVLTGALIRSREILFCGIGAALLNFSMFFTAREVWCYLFAAMFAVGMVVPGHLLNYRARCSKN